MNKHDPRVKNFLKRVACDCIDNNLILTLVDNDTVGIGDKVKCSGSFSEDYGIEVAIGNPISLWFTTLVHEYCHFIQWKTKSKAWRNAHANFKRKYPRFKTDAVSVFHYWATKEKKYYKSIVKDAMQATLELELECEQMTNKMLSEMNIKNYNEKLFIKKSNSYIMYYRLMLETKKFWKDAPYKIREVWSACPDVWLDDYTKVDEYKNWERYKEMAKLLTI